MSSEVFAGMAVPRDRYPHFKRTGDLVYVSGTHARPPGNRFARDALDAMGAVDRGGRTLGCGPASGSGAAMFAFER